MKATKKEKEQAMELGKQAFLDGKKAIPALDKNLMALLKGRKVGEGLPLLKAWAKGWHRSNANQDVEANFIKAIALKDRELAKKVKEVLNK